MKIMIIYLKQKNKKLMIIIKRLNKSHFFFEMRQF